jgi:hypothetical protein
LACSRVPCLAVAIVGDWSVLVDRQRVRDAGDAVGREDLAARDDHSSAIGAAALLPLAAVAARPLFGQLPDALLWIGLADTVAGIALAIRPARPDSAAAQAQGRKLISALTFSMYCGFV